MPHGERIISHPKHVYVCLSLDVVEAARVRLDWSQPNQPLYGCALCRVPFLESATLTSCEIARTLDIRMDMIQQLALEVLKCNLLGYMTQINVFISVLSCRTVAVYANGEENTPIVYLLRSISKDKVAPTAMCIQKATLAPPMF